MEKVGIQDRLFRMLGLGGGMNFDSPNGRDVAWLGECDKGIQLLADKLGWGVSILKLSINWYDEIYFNWFYYFFF